MLPSQPLSWMVFVMAYEIDPRYIVERRLTIDDVDAIPMDYYSRSCLNCVHFCRKKTFSCTSPKVMEKARFKIQRAIGDTYKKPIPQLAYLEFDAAAPLCQMQYWEPLTEHTRVVIKENLFIIAGSGGARCGT